MKIYPISMYKKRNLFIDIHSLIFLDMGIITEKERLMKIYSKWKDEEVKTLFDVIEKGREKNIPLIKLFNDYAVQTGRKPNSVRNYYYIELEALKEDIKRAHRLGIDLSKHKKNDQKEFSNDETRELVMKILKMTSKGISVRKACLTLANGDITQMVRFQNKFRTVVIKQKNLFEECVNQLQQKDIKMPQKTPDNVIAFTNYKTKLTDSDINSLFMGLVKLVKKQATEQASKNQEFEIERANNMLRKTLINLRQKEDEVKTLQKNFKLLTKENERLNEEIKQLRVKNAELLNRQSKMQGLKKFANRYKVKNISSN